MKATIRGFPLDIRGCDCRPRHIAMNINLKLERHSEYGITQSYMQELQKEVNLFLYQIIK